MRTMFLTLFVWATAWVPATFLDTRALIEQALDEKPQITLENIKLRDAVTKLTDQTGVRIMMADPVMAYLPYGADTKINKVEIANIPLRRGLAELFGPLGMTFQVMDDHVAIIPKEPVFLLGRTATWAELDLLNTLEKLHPGSNPDDLKKLNGLIQFQVASRDPWLELSAALKNVGAGPADEALTIGCGSLGWAWRLSDDKVAITTLEHQMRMNLLRRITLRSNSRPLFETLTKIGEQANVPIRLDGADVAPKIYSLNVSDAPAEQVLAKIAAETGFGYIVEPGGVVFYSQDREARPQPDNPDPNITSVNSAARPRVMVKVVETLPGGKTIEYLYWESDLPEELRHRRDEILKLTVEELRKNPVGTK